ncbi:hypothetical protein GCM10022393_22690 [Aquimarina addita]|uniref:Secretion system C-terminal sorting domain-containing protein n=1 Tax=Aquimarina addita TaxID=870485 RepID=A0ABP6UJN0_9FLAO
MKKLVLILWLITINSFAQITVQYHDFASVGDSVIEYYDRTPDESIQAGDSGPNQVWDFSSLKTIGKDTLVYMNPRDTPFSDDFPTANLALYSNNRYEAWMFMKNSPTELINKGSGVFVAGEKRIDISDETFIKYPLQYQDISSNKRSNDEIIEKTRNGTDSIKRTRVWELETLVDAWGDIILPNGTFFSLRLKAVTGFTQFFYRKEKDQWILIKQSKKNTTTCYRWFTHDKNVKYPLAQMVMDDDHKRPIIVKFLPASPFEEMINRTKVDIRAYPNPAKRQISIDMKQQQKSYINIYSFSGQLIKSIQSDQKITDIDLTTISDGTYFIVVRDTEGRILGKSKFIKTN